MALWRRPNAGWLAGLALSIVAGLLPQTASASSYQARTYVPVLMYHYIRVNPEPRDRTGYALSVTPAVFHEQMDYLARNHFHVIPLATAVHAIRSNQALPPRSIVLTFDDGYADFFTKAIPEMRRYGFTATDYVVPGLIGRPSFMSWSQVVSADRLGFTIAAHTMHHVPLARIARASAIAEMRQSKQVLEGMVGHPVIEFAYPYGSFNGYLAGQARAMGFESAASTMPGAWHQPGELWWLDRQRVSGSTSLFGFARLVGGPWPGAALVAPAPAATIVKGIGRWRPRPIGRR
ncbi:MAG TPA: polysaccharide deacetylase family protein [Candidatus Dormibacteraeota bacterium]|jgi:peptidoglycan/xylan/chitin deacetylase (PgdA/CDA1 family)